MTRNNKPHIMIVGAGPAGLGAAYRLTSTGKARVTVIEREPVVGGVAGSFEVAGIRVDFGSHRLHPSCDPAIMAELKTLMGADLLKRPRHGRIRMKGRWIHFPLKPQDLALKLPPSFAAGTIRDMVGKRFARSTGSDANTFATVLEAGLGRTICENFYFPYVEKIWGMSPTEIDAVQARRRVSAGSIGKMIGKVLKAVPGLKPEGAGIFYYPRKGFGQISNALADAARDKGAEIFTNAKLSSIVTEKKSVRSVVFDTPNGPEEVQPDYLWSTIPAASLISKIRPAAPRTLTKTAEGLGYRGMILIYLVLGTRQFTEFDAHYFPEREVPITRLSEPRNYSEAYGHITDRTVLCAELPCKVDGVEWRMTDEQLGGLVIKSLEDSGLKVDCPVLDVQTRRLTNAYPIYTRGYERNTKRVDEWLRRFDNIVCFGRQALFVHDNTHHALKMAWSASDCVTAGGTFDYDKWWEYRDEFESHVVED